MYPIWGHVCTQIRGHNDNSSHLGLSQFTIIYLLKIEDISKKKLLMRWSQLNTLKYTFAHQVVALITFMVHRKIQLLSWIFQTSRINSFWINYRELHSSLQRVNLMDITYLVLSLLKNCKAKWDAWFIAILFVFLKCLMKSIPF